MPHRVEDTTQPAPYRKHQCRIKLDGKYIAGFSEVSGTIDASFTGNGEDSCQIATGMITLKNGASYDVESEEWQRLISSDGSSSFRCDIILEVCNAEGLQVTAYKISGCLLERYGGTLLEGRSLAIESMNVHYDKLTLLAL